MRALKGFFVLLLLLPGATRLHAQWTDTLHHVMHGTIYPTASFDSRNSFISSQRAPIWGVKAGVDFSGYLQIGLGYNFLQDGPKRKVYFQNNAGLNDSATGTIRMHFFSYYIRYVYYVSHHWRFSIMPVQLGLGNSRYDFFDGMTDREKDKRFVMIYEPGISASYKLLKWLGVGGDIGYRIMLRRNPLIKENFNSPIYSFYINIYWGEIYKILLPNTKLAKML